MAISARTDISKRYDHPLYGARGSFNGIMTAGSAGVSQKFVAHAALRVFGLNVYTTIVGTSTYTGGLYGQPASATLAVAATQLNLIKINRTSADGVTIVLATSTVGPFTVGGVFNGAGNTATNQVGAAMYFPLNTSDAVGGLAVARGDQLYVVNGTDGTAVELIGIDYQVVPGADVVG